MKLRIIAAALFCALCLSLAACGDSGVKTGDSAKTDVTTGAVVDIGDASVFSDLKSTVESVKEYYGDNVTFVFKADEYSDEVLMYTYGLFDDKFVSAVEDFVLSECDGMSADTFAVVKFKTGTDKSLIEEAAEIMEKEYVTSLKNKLSAYNPEEFKASDGYQVKLYDDAVMMVISSEHTDDIIAAVGK